MKLHPPPNRICSACDRPLAPHVGVCDYCGEPVFLPVRLRILRIALPTLAIGCAVAWTLPRLLAHPIHPRLLSQLTRPGAALIALGLGLALLPHTLRGVADLSRNERLRLVTPRFLGGVFLLFLAFANTLAACAPLPWSAADIAWLISNAFSLASLPLFFGWSSRSLAAGILIAIGTLNL